MFLMKQKRAKELQILHNKNLTFNLTFKIFFERPKNIHNDILTLLLSDVYILIFIHAGYLSEKMASRPPPKVIEFVEPGTRQRKEKKDLSPVCADLPSF